jgi:hypothetical protein
VKTRDRQESEDSCHEEPSTPVGAGNNGNNQGGSEDVQAYINSIVPNNSIKFAKPTQSVSQLLILMNYRDFLFKQKREDEID